MPNPIQPPAAFPLPPVTPLPTAPSPAEVTTPEAASPENTPSEPVKDQTQATPRPDAAFEPTNDTILFLGINPSAGPESAALKKSAGADKVTVIEDTPNGIVDGYDLSTDSGVEGFTKSLNLPDEQQQQLTKVLLDVQPSMRDEFSQIAKLWAKGEKGEAVPSRIVLSGHSNGKTIFSEVGRGSYSLDTLKSMAEVMPKAASQIEDIHISGCNSGFKFNADRFKNAFPNLKTFWAYTGTAPSTGTNSAGHLKRWEQSTRGHVEALDRSQVSKGLGIRGESVSVWSAEKGYQANPETMDSHHTDEDMFDQTRAYLDGDIDLPTTSGSGPVFDLYEQLQRRQGSLPEDASQRESIEGMTDRVLKLRFYPKVSDNFQKVFAPNIQEVYGAVGIEPPDFSKLNRKEAIASIKQVQEAVKNLPPEAADAQQKNLLVLDGFQDLSPAMMGPEWIEPFNENQIQSQRSQTLEHLTREGIESQRLTSPSYLDFGNLLQMPAFDFGRFGDMGVPEPMMPPAPIPPDGRAGEGAGDIDETHSLLEQLRAFEALQSFPLDLPPTPAE
jgi:hypothetical protein